jgi:hypothetical protein
MGMRIQNIGLLLSLKTSVPFYRPLRNYAQRSLTWTSSPPSPLFRALGEAASPLPCIPSSVADPHHIDADPDAEPDPIYHLDADLDADPDPDFYLMLRSGSLFVVDADPDPDSQNDADPDPDLQHSLKL